MVALPLSTLLSVVLLPVLPLSPSGTVLATEGGDSKSLDSTDLEMWLGEMLSTKDEGLRLGGAP
jgi:hypothetical protein